MATDTKPVKSAETRPATRSKTAVSGLTLGNADDALTLAKELQKFVKANKLTSNIQGKEFPNVEAWQFAGSLLGLSPMLESIEDRSDDTQIKWNATVRIVSLKSGLEVGRGFATCSNKEHTKRAFADYAICSMAQTRATGKAYRLSLGWLMKAAGYEATPAEEMSDVGTSATVVVEPLPASVYTAEEAIKAMLAVSTRAELQELWPQLEAHRGDEIFDLASAATKVRWNAPDYKSLEQIETDVASRTQRDLAHKFLASGKNDAYRLEALHLLADAGMSHAQASTLIEKAKANVEQPVMQVASKDAGTPARVQYATAAQKEEIIRLLNVPVITRPEKTKMLLAINRLDEERAVQAIAKLRKTIDQRENDPKNAA